MKMMNYFHCFIKNAINFLKNMSSMYYYQAKI